MKRLLPLLTLAVLATGFTSCKKDFTCECTYTETENGTVVDTYTTSVTFNARRPEASLSCNASDVASYTVGSSTIKTDCDLK
jgi:hypothetical protein